MLSNWGILFSVFLNPCGEMSDRLANIDGFAPTTFKSVHRFYFSSLEKEDFRGGIQVFIFLVVNIISALVISRTFFANV